MCMVPIEDWAPVDESYLILRELQWLNLNVGHQDNGPSNRRVTCPIDDIDCVPEPDTK